MTNGDQGGIFSSLRGVVETLEQKSGLNPLLFLDAIIGIPSIVCYAIYDRWVLLLLAGAPVIATLIFYSLAFKIDRNFLRSEKHVKEMRQLDLLGEKDKILDVEAEIQQPSISDPASKQLAERKSKK